MSQRDKIRMSDEEIRDFLVSRKTLIVCPTTRTAFRIPCPCGSRWTTTARSA